MAAHSTVQQAALKQISFFLISALLLTAQAPPTRPCKTADLDGFYRLADFWEIPPLSFTIEARQFPYQFLAFFPEAMWMTWGYNALPHSLSILHRDLKPLRGQDYQLASDGRLIMQRHGAIQFAGTCAVAVRPVGGFQENDLILSGAQAQNPSQVHELFRRWTGKPVAGAIASFDPAPSPLPTPPQSTSKLTDVPPSMPDNPVPLRVKVVHGSGPNGPDTVVSIIVTNESHAPLSAFMLVLRGIQTALRWKDWEIDACVMRGAAWQPGQQWTHYMGMPIEVGDIQVLPGAAIFSDGSTWGNPHRLAKLNAHRGNCQWPGS